MKRLRIRMVNAFTKCANDQSSYYQCSVKLLLVVYTNPTHSFAPLLSFDILVNLLSSYLSNNQALYGLLLPYGLLASSLR